MKALFGSLRGSLTRTPRWRLLQALLLTSGLLLVLVASTFLLGGSWDEAPPPRAAAFPGETGVETSSDPATPAFLTDADAEDIPEPTGRPTPTAQKAGPESAADQSLGGVLDQVGIDLQLTPTPPAPTSTPTSPPAPAQPATPPPQQVVAPPPSEPVAPPPPAPTATPVSPPEPSCPAASMSGFGLDLFNAINNERTGAGMPALAAHGCVVYVAQLRSDDMASRSYFAHSSPEGETAFSLMDAYGVPYGWAGENLARNNYPDDETVAVAIRDLMASEGHRANILNGNYTHLGVAMAVDGEGIRYYTMVFIGPA